MADALVGGALLSAFLQVLFDRLASREVVDYVRGRKFDGGLLRNLKIMLLSVDAVLADAETKQITNPSVKKWVDELKDAAYDAEDLLDEIATKSLRDRLGGDEAQTCTKLVCISTFISEKNLSSRMENILARIEFIVRQKDVLGLKEAGGKLPYRFPTTSLVEETGVYGRDDDREAVLTGLLSNDGSSVGMSVISIVGMGGVGKTTLAQLVYNDARVKEQFDLRVWIYVSDEYDVFRVTKTILEAVSSSTFDTNDLNLLQLELKERLTDRKLLLVLDDVWNDNYIEWEVLQGPFKSVAHGSKIIVTTRSKRVASAVRSKSTHHLRQLSDEDCWFLFAKQAFDNRNFRAHPNLELIGRKISKKCNGLPLAAKALGCLLYSRLDDDEWDLVLKSNIWDLPCEGTNILPALRLSYHYLPSHLKRCFAYCAIFPKNYQFVRRQLVHLWMAEDLLQPRSRKQTKEEVGIEYFRELKSRSFFQPSSCNKSWFVMHELVKDLASFVSGEFCFTMGNENSDDSLRKTRYLSYSRTRYDASKRFEAFYGAKRLRTFLPSLNASNGENLLGDKVLHDLIPALRCLRVLSLSSYKNVTELPNSIGNLQHLRFLNLSCTSIKKLPNSICNLHNLQTLELFGCGSLKELPTNMGRLIKLRYLNIEKTNVRKLPSQISRLKDLQKLSTYIVGKHDELGIWGLGEFQLLRGRLSIFGLQNVSNTHDALRANLHGKKHLTELSFNWSKTTDDSEIERVVLENLQPSTKLKHLSIRFYGGTQLPDWLGNPSFSNIVEVDLRFCKYCFFLPPLGQLPYLEILSIVGFDSIEKVGPEFYGNNSPLRRPFSSLKVLKFENMLEWCEWVLVDSGNEAGAFPCLEELCIRNCPKLAGMLPSHLPSLRKLVVTDCEQLAASNLGTLTFSELETGNCDELVYTEFPHTLKNLSIEGSINYSSLRSFPLGLLSELQYLSIQDCCELRSFSIVEGVQVLISLSYLRIKGCPYFVSFPHGGLCSPNLKTMSISNCDNLTSLPEQMSRLLPSLQNLYICNCTELAAVPEGGFPSKLNVLTITRCKKMIANRREWGLQNLLNLASLSVGGTCENVESFPEEGLLPTSLTYLSIHEMSSLRSLNRRGLQSLTSLQELKICDCPKLQCVPKEGIPTSLICLIIVKCPLLKKHYRKMGEEWSGIGHIPCIQIDRKVIMS